MNKILTATLASFLVISGPLLAEEVPLDTAQIQTLLAGKSIKGVHYGVETRQYFSESGLTLWIKSDDTKPSEARYKIENKQYCSSWTGLWSEEEYGCFKVHHDEEQNIHYFISDSFRAPFVVGSKFDLSFD
ncbi:MAG: hypothetical protein PF480_08800 [Roseovarius sp.]|jgi:hypothetical protein|nr:hypothetical protein [Roseovarius sp.]